MPADPSVKVPPNTVVILGGQPYQLRWDKAAMFRADEIGLFEKRKPGIGLAGAAKYVWCMIPAEGRERFAAPVDVATVLPPLAEAWETITNAIDAGKEGTSAKNVFGSTSGPLPASS